MNNFENMELRLWDYIDGLSSTEERSFIEKLIEENIEWRRKYHELLDAHQLLQQNIELDEPSMRFSANVMDAIAHEKIAPAASSYIKKPVIRGIAIFFLVSFVAMLVYVGVSLDWSALNKPNSSFKLPELNLGKYMSSTLFNSMAIVTVVLALALIDTAIRKKQKKNREITE
ncbi:MAG: hypothetical protein J7578_14455 [Chitinophagaceae bacterium]|nr:hypothetical protein [Chitinophagaceae bacterium]